jgi:hypothetical protein
VDSEKGKSLRPVPVAWPPHDASSKSRALERDIVYNSDDEEGQSRRVTLLTERLKTREQKGNSTVPHDGNKKSYNSSYGHARRARVEAEARESAQMRVDGKGGLKHTTEYLAVKDSEHPVSGFDPDSVPAKYLIDVRGTHRSLKLESTAAPRNSRPRSPSPSSRAARVEAVAIHSSTTGRGEIQGHGGGRIGGRGHGRGGGRIGGRGRK